MAVTSQVEINSDSERRFKIRGHVTSLPESKFLQVHLVHLGNWFFAFTGACTTIFMARLRKEKGRSSAHPKVRKGNETIANKPKGGKKSSSNPHISTLGGNKDDIELLKNVDDGALSGTANTDVNIPVYSIIFVSNVLNSLL